MTLEFVLSVNNGGIAGIDYLKYDTEILHDFPVI